MTDLDPSTDSDRHGLDAAAPDTIDMSHTDLPASLGEPADDTNPLHAVTPRSYRDAALRTIAESKESPDPVRYRTRWLDHLEARAEAAEQWARSAETSLRRAVDAMQRREEAARQARRRQGATNRLLAIERAEAERLRRNARQRADYARRRSEERSRRDHRAGTHALAIVVDPVAYAALKAEAYRQRTSIPRLLGAILATAPASPPSEGRGTAPRWRRTGQGRRANQHTRIVIGDDDWHRLHVEAIAARTTVGRWIGAHVEAWAEAHRSTADGGNATGPAGIDELMPQTIADAAVDRLMPHANVLPATGDSVRLTQATR